MEAIKRGLRVEPISLWEFAASGDRSSAGIQRDLKEETMKWGEKVTQRLGVRGLYVVLAITLLAILSGAHHKWG
jgi:hypothetical protein